MPNESFQLDYISLEIVWPKNRNHDQNSINCTALISRDAPIWSAPIHIGRYSHYQFWSAFSKRPIKTDKHCRSDEIKSAIRSRCLFWKTPGSNASYPAWIHAIRCRAENGKLFCKALWVVIKTRKALYKYKPFTIYIGTAHLFMAVKNVKVWNCCITWNCSYSIEGPTETRSVWKSDWTLKVCISKVCTLRRRESRGQVPGKSEEGQGQGDVRLHSKLLYNAENNKWVNHHTKVRKHYFVFKNEHKLVYVRLPLTTALWG